MSLLKVVLDTNAVLRSISRRSEYAKVIDKLHDGAFELWITNGAFACNAHYLVTNDKHFNVLKSIDFPAINTITLEDFVKRI